MSKYYKAEDVIRAIDRVQNGYNGWSDRFDKAQIIGVIEELPTIEVSEGCISREDAIKAYNEAIDELVKAEMEEFNLGDFTECSFNTTQLKLIARKIDNTPSVLPSREEGEWIRTFDGNEWFWYCSNCKDQWYEEDLWMGGNEFPHYCPNCGARMEIDNEK